MTTLKVPGVEPLTIKKSAAPEAIKAVRLLVAKHPEWTQYIFALGTAIAATVAGATGYVVAPNPTYAVFGATSGVLAIGLSAIGVASKYSTFANRGDPVRDLESPANIYLRARAAAILKSPTQESPMSKINPYIPHVQAGAVARTATTERSARPSIVNAR